MCWRVLADQPLNDLGPPYVNAIASSGFKIPPMQACLDGVTEEQPSSARFLAPIAAA